MLLKIFLLNSLAAELALDSHAVVDDLFEFLKCFNFIFQRLLLRLHLYYLRTQVIVHLNKVLVPLCQLIVLLTIVRDVTSCILSGLNF